jgi:hypothetical protein
VHAHNGKSPSFHAASFRTGCASRGDNDLTSLPVLVAISINDCELDVVSLLWGWSGRIRAMTTLADDLMPDELWAIVEPLLPAPPRPRMTAATKLAVISRPWARPGCARQRGSPDGLAERGHVLCRQLVLAHDTSATAGCRMLAHQGEPRGLGFRLRLATHQALIAVFGFSSQ